MRGITIVENHDRLLMQMADATQSYTDRFAAKLAEIEQRREREQQSPMWLSHHFPDEYDRCVRMGRHHVCRRCIVLYSISLTVAVAVAAGARLWPTRFDLWIVWLACLPATVEFALEQAGRIRHHPLRQSILTGILAVAFGRGLGAELQDRWDWLFWGPILVYGAIWGGSAILGHRRRSVRPGSAV